MKGVVHDIPNDIRGAWWYHEVFIGHIRQSPAAGAISMRSVGRLKCSIRIRWLDEPMLVHRYVQEDFAMLIGEKDAGKSRRILIEPHQSAINAWCLGPFDSSTVTSRTCTK